MSKIEYKKYELSQHRFITTMAALDNPAPATPKAVNQNATVSLRAVLNPMLIDFAESVKAHVDKSNKESVVAIQTHFTEKLAQLEVKFAELETRLDMLERAASKKKPVAPRRRTQNDGEIPIDAD